MPTPQLTDYPEALQVFEDNNLEAEFELREEDKEVILKIKEIGTYRWNNRRHIQISRLPDPTDKEATNAFWNRIWQDLHVYPKVVIQYSIPSNATWISIRDNQPDNNQPVLVYGELPMSNGKRILVATYRESRGQTYPNSFDYATPDFRTLTVSGVTHWIPLPEPPPRRSAE
jgi:hypothetical protein